MRDMGALDKQFVFSHTGHSVLISTRGAAFHVLRDHLKSGPNYSNEIESIDPAGDISWVDVPVDVGTAVYNYMLAQSELINPPASSVAGAPENHE